jgi:Na+/H+ antiporter NhaD/arsenite permease-like protein
MTESRTPDHGKHRPRLHGPKLWVISALAGLALGALLGLLVPGVYTAAGHPVTPLWLVAPFVLLLASIALMPFINAHFWHLHYPDVALLLGGLTTGYYLLAYGRHGAHDMLHAGVEYYSFIALVGGLFVVSGGILVDIRGYAGPFKNTVILAVGAVLANIVGTTGASMLLIRPFMRINRGRLMPIHIVFFIFIVSNCGGSLTPIGDPPLYLGFLKGVPFSWTLTHLWKDWIFVIGALLILFYSVDRFYIAKPAEPTFAPLPTYDEAGNLMEAEVHAKPGLRLGGPVGIVALLLMIAGVFIDPAIHKWGPAPLHAFPLGATFQICVALAAYFLANPTILRQNDFNFGPVKEVGLLFLGIFATMVPALAYLAHHGKDLGIDSPTAFYFGSGALSSFLDNAPTYLNFLQLALGDAEMSKANVLALIHTHEGVLVLQAISTGAVFFGAMTYIGNGPNFMVKAIAEAEGVRMPSFISYVLLAVLLLLPILVLHWAVFILWDPFAAAAAGG